MMAGGVVLVTGAAQGIGRYIAHTFASAGARLAVADILPVDKVCGEIQELGSEALPLKADVSDEDQVRAMVEIVLQHYGRIDVLVNNAAIVPHFMWGGPRWPPIRAMDKAFWDRVIGVNLGGTVLCSKHVIPAMRRQGSGHIINLYGGGSAAGAEAYVVSKEAIRSLTYFLGLEEQDAGVCVVCLSPGAAIATETAPEEARARMPGTDIIGTRFVQAAELPLEFSGHLVDLKDGALIIADN